MARFTIYSYPFKPINEPELFAPKVNAEESMKKKLEIFDGLFGTAPILKFY